MRKAPVIFFHTGKKPFLFCFFAYLALIAAISALCLNMPAAKRIFFDEEFMRGAFPIVCGVSPYGAFPLAAEKHADNTPREASSGQKNYKKRKRARSLLTKDKHQHIPALLRHFFKQRLRA